MKAIMCSVALALVTSGAWADSSAVPVLPPVAKVGADQAPAQAKAGGVVITPAPATDAPATDVPAIETKTADMPAADAVVIAPASQAGTEQAGTAQSEAVNDAARNGTTPEAAAQMNPPSTQSTTAPGHGEASGTGQGQPADPKPAVQAEAAVAPAVAVDCADTGAATPATQGQGAPGNTESTGWSGGTGGSHVGTTPQGAVRESKTWHAPTARGLDLMGKAPVVEAQPATPATSQPKPGC